MIGIVCAMPDELEGFLKYLDNTETHDCLLWKVYKGTIGKLDVVLVLSGVGKVNAALAVALLVNDFATDFIISAGISGIIDRELTLGDIVIGKEFCYHDCQYAEFSTDAHRRIVFYMIQCFQQDASFVSHTVDFLNSRLPGFPKVLQEKQSTKFPKVKPGKIITGDVPVDNRETVDRLRRELNADCVDMESAAVSHACGLFNVPFLVIRIMSDFADEKSYISILRYGKHLISYLAGIVSLVIENIMFICSDYK